MRTAMLLMVLFAAVRAQTPLETANLLNLTDRLQEAIDASDWQRAAELSGSLKQAVQESRNRSLSLNAEEQIDRMLGWLPADTETVIVARDPFRLDFNSQRGQRPPSAVRVMQGYVVTPMAAKGLEEAVGKLEGQTLRSAVFAARRFQDHEPGTGNVLPLGLIAYQGCGLYSLAKPLNVPLFLRSSEGSIAGYSVWSAKNAITGYPGGSPIREETLFVSQPEADLIVVCNDRAFFSEVLSRINGLSRIRAFPADHPLLRLADRNAPVWAVRRFLPERAGIDPSHPATGGLTGVVDGDATGVVVEAGGSKNVIRAQWLSRSRVNPWQALSNMPEFRGNARVQQNREGIWQITVEQDGNAALNTAWALMGMLGFVAVI
jgi:hypothetical protein